MDCGQSASCLKVGSQGPEIGRDSKQQQMRVPKEATYWPPRALSGTFFLKSLLIWPRPPQPFWDEDHVTQKRTGFKGFYGHSVNVNPVFFTIEDVVGTLNLFSLAFKKKSIKLMCRETICYISRTEGTLIYLKGVPSPANFSLLSSVLYTSLAKSVSVSLEEKATLYLSGSLTSL